MFGSVALVVTLRTTIFSPGGDPVALAHASVKLGSQSQLRPWSGSSCLYCLAKGLPPGQGIPPLPPTTPPSKGPLNGFLQEGRQASTCDLEFISYPRTWLRLGSENLRLTCIVSRYELICIPSLQGTMAPAGQEHELMRGGHQEPLHHGPEGILQPHLGHSVSPPKPVP